MTQQYNAVYKNTYPVESGRSKSPSLVESILFVIDIFYSQLYIKKLEKSYLVIPKQKHSDSDKHSETYVNQNVRVFD
jgi:hypothetical protein